MLNAEQEKIIEELRQEAKANNWSNEQIIEALKEHGFVPENSVQELDLEAMENVAGGGDFFETCVDGIQNGWKKIEDGIRNIKDKLKGV